MAANLDEIFANLALSDSWHDFHSDKYDPEQFGEDGLDAFNDSMPINASKSLNENNLLNLVCPEDLRELLNEPSGTRNRVNTYTGKTFATSKISIFEVDGETIATKLPKSIAMVVDFNQSGFLERLTRGPRNENKTFYYLYNSEVENDPASKTPSTDPVFTSKSGIALKYLEQTGTNPVVYSGIPKNTPYNDNINILEKFYSTHTLTLSPIQKQLMFGKGKKTSVTLTVTNAGGTRVHHVPDAKKSNSIKALLTEFLAKILRSRDLKNPENKFGANVSWTQKRSGDWLQVLSCLDAHNRKYNNSNLPEVPVFFVTHDRVAMAYSLLMGVNTIFIKGAEKEIIVFTRPGDSNVDLAKLADEQVKGLTDRENVIEFLKKFSEMREKQIETNLENLKNATTIQEIFKWALHTAHTILDIPNVREIINTLTPGILFSGANSQAIMKAYTTAKGIIHDHRGSPDFKNSFNTYFERKDLFTALQRATVKTTISTRLIAAFTGNVDKYSFLGYIAKVDTNEGETLKKLILEKIKTFETTESADLIANTRVILQLKPTFVGTVIDNEIINTSNFQEVVRSEEISMNRDKVIHANVYNDFVSVKKDHIADSSDPPEASPEPETGGKRRTRRNKKGGWLSTHRYAKKGLSIDFPIKQTTHALIVAHIIANPISRTWCFGMCGTIERFSYESEIGSASRGSVLSDGVVSERVDYQDPEQLEPVAIKPEPASEPVAVKPEPEQDPVAVEPKHVTNAVQKSKTRGSNGIDTANIIEGPRNRKPVKIGGGESSDHLFPIYVSLEALEPNVGERLEGSMDIDLYTRYYTFLQKLSEKVTPLTGDDKDALAFALREVLFISAQHVVGRESIAACLGTTVAEMMSFASMSTILSNYICGELPKYTPEYEAFVSKALQMPVIVGIIRGAYTESATVTPMTVPELSNAVKKLRADLASQITQVDAVKPVPEEVPLKIPQRQIEDVGDPTAVGARRRRTRRLTKDFLQTTRHQSIKMSSRRHSLSGKALNF